MRNLRNWFKKNKKILTVVAVLVGGPPAAIYINGADAALEAVEILTEPEPAAEQAN